MVKSTDGSHRGPGVIWQFIGISYSSSRESDVLFWSHMWYTDTHSGKTLMKKVYIYEREREEEAILWKPI